MNVNSYICPRLHAHYNAAIHELHGHDAQMHNDGYLEERTKLHNRLLRELMDTFCDEPGMIDWERLVRFNSQNMV